MADAVLQLEFDRLRFASHYTIGDTAGSQKTNDLIFTILTRAMKDTIINGGTLVLSVTDTTVTVVQRMDGAEDFDVPADDEP